MRAVRREHWNNNIISFCLLQNLNIASMAAMSIHKKYYWLKRRLRLYDRYKMTKPFREHFFRHPPGSIGLPHRTGWHTVKQ